MPALNDITGQRFGRLVVIRHLPDGYALVRCECGGEKQVRRGHLTTGATISCGCARIGNPTHGLSKHPLYKVWAQMLQRCNNSNDPKYADYGGRGIAVCDRWSTFPNFLADMGERPYGMSIDREDNDGNYEPGNCRWATPLEQRHNRRDSR